MKMSTSLIALAALGMSAFSPRAVCAGTWKDPATGYTWTYYVDEGEVWIEGREEKVGGEWIVVPAVSPKPSGALSVPAKLGDKPVFGLGWAAFYGCTGLTDVTLPKGLVGIGGNVFENCKALKTVKMPGQIEWIGENAFTGCISLEEVVFGGNAPEVNEDIEDGFDYSSFAGVPPTCIVRVRHGTTGWGVAIPGTWNGMQIRYAADVGMLEMTVDPVTGGGLMKVTVSRVDGAAGRVAVKLKTQDSATVGGINGVSGRDFEYVKEYLVWEDGDASDKVVYVPTYATDADGEVTFRLKLSVQTTGDYADCVTPDLASGGKVIASVAPAAKGTLMFTAPDPMSVLAGEPLRVKVSRVGGTAGRVAVKLKTQDSATVDGINGVSGRDFQYVKQYLEWEDGDATDREVEIPTYAAWWDGEPRTFRLKLSVQTTGDYAGCVTPALADGGKVIASIEPNEAAYPGAVVVKSVETYYSYSYEPPLWGYAGYTLRVTLSREGGGFGRVAVKAKTQDASTVNGLTALFNTDFTYAKDTFVWEDGETEDKTLEIPTFLVGGVTYPRTFRLKLSAMMTGDYEGCTAPELPEPKVIIGLLEE